MTRPFIFLVVFIFGSANAFIEGGFDPNAVNGFGEGSFNPNAGFSTIAPPSINGGNPESGFDPNKGLATTIAPPEFNGFTGWAGSGHFDPNSGHLVATTSSPESGGFGGWGWQNGGTARKRGGSETDSPYEDFGNDYWGFATGSGGFVPLKTSPTITTSTTTATTTTTTTTIHPSTLRAKPLIFGRSKTTPLPTGGQRDVKNKRIKRHPSSLLRILKLSQPHEPLDVMSHILG